jgi:uncharacterized protein (DUF2126 family)
MTVCTTWKIALDQMPGPATAHAPPWLVDRLFRNILADVTGNTHRAEICIDKLYSPDGPTGRLGLDRVPLVRNAADPRMSTCAAIADPRAGRPVLARAQWTASSRAGARRCTTASCCRIMSGRISSTCSPISVAPAITSIRNGSRRSWEFRFPFYGEVEYAGVKLELRQALEPWHVLGEESGAIGGTVRFVDSSVERLQVKVTGFNAGAVCHRVQPSPDAADIDRRNRRSLGRRRALQGLAARFRDCTRTASATHHLPSTL